MANVNPTIHSRNKTVTVRTGLILTESPHLSEHLREVIDVRGAKGLSLEAFGLQ